MHSQWQSPSGPTTTATTTTTVTTTTTNYNHNHRILQQIPNPKTSTKKKKINSKSSTKPQPNKSINDQTQPTIGGEIGGESYGGRRAKIGDCPWASRALDWRAELQIGKLQSASSALDRNCLHRDKKRKRER